jgi:carbonic anhydrase
MQHSTSQYHLKKISNQNDLPAHIIGTPFENLIKYHNLGVDFKEYETAELAIVMCMDNRKQLNIPNKFAYILRTAGARITGNEFKLSFVIGFGDIKHIALISHTNCGMVNLTNKKEKVIEGLVKNAGWTKEAAESHFNNFAPFFEIENEVNFVVSESKRLIEKYPLVSFIPMLYNVEDNLLYLIVKE